MALISGAKVFTTLMNSDVIQGQQAKVLLLATTSGVDGPMSRGLLSQTRSIMEEVHSNFPTTSIMVRFRTSL